MADPDGASHGAPHDTPARFSLVETFLGLHLTEADMTYCGHDGGVFFDQIAANRFVLTNIETHEQVLIAGTGWAMHSFDGRCAIARSLGVGLGSLDEGESEVKEVDELFQNHLMQAQDGELYVKYKGQTS